MIKEEPIHRTERFGARLKTRRQEIGHADFAEFRIGHYYTNSQQQKQFVTNAGKGDTMQTYADKITQTTEQ